MAEEIRVDVDEAAVRELFADWNGPVGEAVQQVVDEVESIAQGLAPVSPIGSRFAPREFLRESTRQSVEHHYGPDGEVIGLVGAAVFPFAFISNFRSHKGYTYNARSAKHPGKFSVRKADDDYLEDAINSVPHIVIGEES